MNTDKDHRALPIAEARTSSETDRELLTKAAVLYFDGAPRHIGEGVLDWVRDCRGEWNPLKDDGDAFRLAAKLGLVVYFPDKDDPVAVAQTGFGTRAARHLEESAGDESAASRRAIVRAAATIRSTPNGP